MNIENSWKPLPILFFHILALALLLSLFYPPTFYYWNRFDIWCFQNLNDLLKNSWGHFWGFANHRLTDWVEDGVFLILCLLAIKKTRSSERKQKTASLIFSFIFIALTIVCVNRLLFRDLLHLRRFSPTLILDGCMRISDQLPWLDVKEHSKKCFPGDHATTALLFAVCYTYICGKKWGFWAILFAFFFCLPRLITGAHWLSDIVVGSGSIILISFSWAFFTPLHRKATTLFLKPFKKEAETL